jgi:uncharacterized membrane protein
MVDGYTVTTTVILGIVVVAAAYFLYHVFRKLKVRIDEKLLLGLVPWVVLAALIRVYEDAGIYPETFFTVTPGILILLIVVIVPVFFAAKWLEDKRGFALWKSLALAGTIGVIVHLPLLPVLGFQNLYGAALVFIIFSIVLGVMRIARRFVKIDGLSFWAIAAQLFDASATFVALSYFGYGEQHVLPTFLISSVGPWVMFPLKLAVVLPIVYVLDRYTTDKQLRNFLLIAIFLLGFAPGLRDALRLAANV